MVAPSRASTRNSTRVSTIQQAFGKVSKSQSAPASAGKAVVKKSVEEENTIKCVSPVNVSTIGGAKRKRVSTSEDVDENVVLKDAKKVGFLRTTMSRLGHFTDFFSLIKSPVYGDQQVNQSQQLDGLVASLEPPKVPSQFLLHREWLMIRSRSSFQNYHKRLSSLYLYMKHL